MKRTTVILSVAAALGVVGALVEHVAVGRRCAALEHDRRRLLADTRRVGAQAAETNRRVEAARTRAEAIAARANRTFAADRAFAPATSAAAKGQAAAPVASAPPASNPELHALRVQTFVGEQRMQFAPLLHRLGFTPAQRADFERIQADFFRAMHDEKRDATDREQAHEAHRAALRDLFGTNHDAWLEANRQQSARAIVDQIIHQTFPSSGALNAAQADELTRIVAQHRVKGSAADRPDAAAYDWEQIIANARTTLADRQMEDFITAVGHRRASDEMAAIVRNARR